ncbi:MAG: hypothetical protein Q4F49_03130 [Pseudoxanthomonas suwonensis]|nr:hypothetical protein [Pseudoxanthomonas suwonensis]
MHSRVKIVAFFALGALFSLHGLPASADQSDGAARRNSFAVDRRSEMFRSDDFMTMATNWIAPILTRTYPADGIPTNGILGGWNTAWTEHAHRDLLGGVTVFCEHAGGTVREERRAHPMLESVIRTSPAIACVRGDTELGTIHLQDVIVGEKGAAVLYLAWATPVVNAERQERRRAWQENFERSEQELGPSGWVQTREGRHRFVRIGTFERRHVVYFDGIDPKDLVSVTWLSQCCDVLLKLRDGSERTVNEGRISRVLARNSSSSYGLDGFPLVIRDTRTQTDRELKFPNYQGLVSITFDPVSEWSKAGTIRPSTAQRSVAGATSPSPPPIAPATPRPATQPASPAVSSGFAIGTRICRTVISSVDVPLNFSYLGRRATERLHGSTTITGFAEASAPPRVQVRVSGLRFMRDPSQQTRAEIPTSNSGQLSLDTFELDGSTLRVGSIIWGKASDWTDCE